MSLSFLEICDYQQNNDKLDWLVKQAFKYKFVFNITNCKWSSSIASKNIKLTPQHTISVNKKLYKILILV
jgi:hypothetical protein